MGWSKVAEVVLQSDADNITIPLTVQNNRLYLILGEGKCDGELGNIIRFGIDTGIPDEFYVDAPAGFQYSEQSLYALGLISVRGGNFVAMFLGFTLVAYTNQRVIGIGDCDAEWIQVPASLPVYLCIQDGIFKAGFKIVILEKPIE
jgi:hypothetical protein